MGVVTLNTTLTIRDAVQGVTQFLVERNINSGSYQTVNVPEESGGDENGYYLCPSTPDAQTETEVYAFAYQEVLHDILYSSGDTVQWRFTPAGYDAGNGDAFESDQYTIQDFNPVAGQSGFINGFSLSL